MIEGRPTVSFGCASRRRISCAVSIWGIVSLLGCGDAEPKACRIPRTASSYPQVSGGGAGIAGSAEAGASEQPVGGRSAGGATGNGGTTGFQSAAGGYSNETGGTRSGGTTGTLGGTGGVSSTVVGGEAGQLGTGGSAPICAAGSADCDGSAATICETDVLNSARHCGACHHDCEGASCVEGRCQPQPLEVIGTDLAGLAVGGDLVYWSTKPQPSAGVTSGLGPAEIHRCATSGCGEKPEVFASGFTLSLSVRLSNLAIAADRNDVYWMVGHVWNPIGNLVLSCSTSGCPVAGPVTMDAGGESFFALTGLHLFWRDVGTNSIKVWPRGGGAVSTVASYQEKGRHVVADDEDVFWDQNQTILRCPLGTDCGVFGASKVYSGSVASSTIVEMSLVGRDLYWSTWQADGAAILTCNKRNCPQPTILRRAVGLTQAATFYVQPSRLFVGTYPTAKTVGELSVCELPDCKTILKLATFSKPIYQLTGDSRRLFWISEQTVMKLVLP